MNEKTALILFAHGARDPRWALPFEAIAAEVRQQWPSAQVPQVHLAYLEFMSPGLVEAAEAAIQTGAVHVRVVPLFLGAGGHVRKDLPVLMDTLQQRHPGVRFELEVAIGERAEVVKAMAKAITSTSPTPAADDPGAAR